MYSVIYGIYMYIYLTFEPTFCIHNEEPNNFQPPPEAQQQFFPDPSIVNNQNIHQQFNKTKKDVGIVVGVEYLTALSASFAETKRNLEVLLS